MVLGEELIPQILCNTQEKTKNAGFSLQRTKLTSLLYPVSACMRLDSGDAFESVVDAEAMLGFGVPPVDRPERLPVQPGQQAVFVLDCNLSIMMALEQPKTGVSELCGLNVVDYIKRQYSDSLEGLHALVDEFAESLLQDSQGVFMWPLCGHGRSLNPSHLRVAWHHITPSSNLKLILSLGEAHAADRRLTPASQALPAQKAFVNQLVHELRTPLAIASGSLKRACVRVPESQLDVREHLSVAEQELRRIRRLVDHLSLLTDVETGSKRWTLLLQSVGELLGEWQRQLSPALQARLVRILCPHVLDECVYVAADALAVVIDNLCDNAMRYSPAGSPVVVMLASAGSVVNLYVADWGSGIPAKQRQHVFDPFRRLEEHRDPARADGSGLGLSVCRSLIEMMHGTIEILPALGYLRFDAPSTVVKVSLPRISEKGMDFNEESNAFKNSGLNRQQLAGLLVYLERCGESKGWPRSLTASDGA